MIPRSRRRLLWSGVIVASIAVVYVAACDSDAGVELPPQCRRCKPTGSTGARDFSPSGCDPSEVEIAFDACEAHACCAPKSWEDAGPCVTEMRTVECAGGMTCFLNDAGLNVCGSVDATALSCGSISCSPPCTCTQSTPPACLCPNGRCERSYCYVGQVCTPSDIPSCVAPEKTDGGVECGWIGCAPPCTCADASASACACP